MTMNELIRQMRERDEMMRRLAEGPLADLRRHETMIANAAELTRTMELDKIGRITDQLASRDVGLRIAEAVRHTETIFAQFRTPEFIAAVERAEETQRQMGEVVQRMAFAYRDAASQLVSVVTRIDAALKTLPSVDFTRIGILIETTQVRRDRLAVTTERLITRHAVLAASVATDGRSPSALPAPVAEQPALGMFVHAGAVRSITPHQSIGDAAESRSVSIRVEVATETVLFLEENLPQLNPPFLDQYRGVRASAANRGPDWWTQGSASMRKLLKGVLHRAAPDDLVLPWAHKNNKERDRNGHPTRATKIEWLCEFVADDDYRRYLRAELESTLAIIAIVDNAQHVDSFPDFEKQYDWIMLRAEVAVRHILTLWRARESH